MCVGQLGALERVRADQLRQSRRLVRGRGTRGTHLVQDDSVPALGELPCRLTAGQAATDDVNRMAGTNPCPSV